MKKKILILAMVLNCFATACSSKEKPDDGKYSENTNANEYVVTYDEAKVELDKDFETVKSKLGEPSEYAENKSCLYDGYDKTYTYEDLLVITYPINGQEKIASITVLSEKPTVTYDYYQKNIKPKPQTAEKKGWRCKICGYIYEEEVLPSDFICPICKHGAVDFEKI